MQNCTMFKQKRCKNYTMFRQKRCQNYTMNIALTKTPLQILLLRLFAVNAWFSVSSWILHLPPHCPKGEDY